MIPPGSWFSHDLDPTPEPGSAIVRPHHEGGAAMAYREIGMWEILEVLRRVARGEPQRAMISGSRATAGAASAAGCGRRASSVRAPAGWHGRRGTQFEGSMVAILWRASSPEHVVPPGGRLTALGFEMPGTAKLPADLPFEVTPRGIRGCVWSAWQLVKPSEDDSEETPVGGDEPEIIDMGRAQDRPGGAAARRRAAWPSGPMISRAPPRASSTAARTRPSPA